METEIFLQPNSQLILIKMKEDKIRISKEEKIGIYKKEKIIDTETPIYVVRGSDIYIEEIPIKNRHVTNLIEIRSWVTRYSLKFIEIDLKKQINIEKKELYSEIKPKKLSQYMYMISKDKQLTLLNASGEEFPIEENIRKYLKDKEINNIELHNFDLKKNPYLYELIIEFAQLETLHIYLKIDKELKVYNTFYSEMAAGTGFVFDENQEKEQYINEDTFYQKLSRHSILKELEMIQEWEEENKKKQKNKIRKKVWVKIPRVEE